MVQQGRQGNDGIVVVGRVDDYCRKLAISILSSLYSEWALCLSGSCVFASFRLVDSTGFALIVILATFGTDPGTVFWSRLFDDDGIPVLAGVGL